MHKAPRLSQRDEGLSRANDDDGLDYLFCGKPRSTPRKRGSGQRAMTFLLRV
jgi:hypothetical protein